LGSRSAVNSPDSGPNATCSSYRNIYLHKREASWWNAHLESFHLTCLCSAASVFRNEKSMGERRSGVCRAPFTLLDVISDSVRSCLQSRGSWYAAIDSLHGWGGFLGGRSHCRDFKLVGWTLLQAGISKLTILPFIQARDEPGNVENSGTQHRAIRGMGIRL